MEVDDPKINSTVDYPQEFTSSSSSSHPTTNVELIEDTVMTTTDTLVTDIERFLQFVLKVPWSSYKDYIPVEQIQPLTTNSSSNINLKRLELLIDVILADVIRDHNNGNIITTANEGDINVQRKESHKQEKVDSSANTMKSEITEDTTDENDDVKLCPKPTVLNVNSSIKGSILYLVNAYQLLWNYPKIINDEILTVLNKKLFEYCMIILSNMMSPEDRSFVELLQTDMITEAFCRNLIEVAYRYKTFTKIFSSVLHNLYYDMRIACADKVINTSKLIVLKKLTCITITVDDVTIRPICDLISTLDNFIPDLCTKHSAGREVARVCYLSPFLSLSVFVEDNPKLAENYLASSNIFDKVVVAGLQSVSL